MDTDSETAPLSGQIIERLVSALGRDLLEFILNSQVTSLEDGTALANPTALALQLDQFLLQEIEGEINPTAFAEMLKFRLTDTSVTPQPLALTFRETCGGRDQMPTCLNSAEEVLVQLARHAYPSFLLPDENDAAQPRWTGFASIRATSAIFRDPLREKFEAELMKDRHISKAFRHANDTTGTYAMLRTSTGRGGSIQLQMLAHQVLNTAWRGLKPTLAEFVQRSLEQLRLIRAAFANQTVTVPARLSFAGVLLPSTGPYEFGDVQIRASTAIDREFVPASLTGQLNGTDVSGQQTTINYAGDVIGELQIPYIVQASNERLGDVPEPWPEDLLKVNNIDSVTTRLRASLLLAVEREYRVQIALSWHAVEDPLNGPSIGWSQPEQFIGIMPTALTEDETSHWSEWYKLLSAPGAYRINLAISRVVRATGERRDHVDVLIDSVIAWENLFGTKDGEPTLRVTASLALLLEPDPAKRRALRSELGKIYRLRSDAVHGTSVPKMSDIPLCFRALDIAILAIRTLLKDRPDVLAESDGGSRSLRLILGEPPPVQELSS